MCAEPRAARCVCPPSVTLRITAESRKDWRGPSQRHDTPEEGEMTAFPQLLEHLEHLEQLGQLEQLERAERADSRSAWSG